MTPLIPQNPGTIDTPPARKAAVSLIQRDDGRVLCVWNLRYNGFSLPGGMVEEGESVEAALRRELKEETSCEVATATLLFEGEHHLRPKTGERDGRASVVAVYRVTATGEPRETEPGGRVAWLTWKEFLDQSPFGAFYHSILPDGPDGEVELLMSPRHGDDAKPSDDGLHTFACVEYAARTRRAFCIVECADARRGRCSDNSNTKDAEFPITERASAARTLARIAELATHDSEIYRLATEEHAWLALDPATQRYTEQLPEDWVDANALIAMYDEAQREDATRKPSDSRGGPDRRRYELYALCHVVMLAKEAKAWRERGVLRAYTPTEPVPPPVVERETETSPELAVAWDEPMGSDAPPVSNPIEVCEHEVPRNGRCIACDPEPLLPNTIHLRSAHVDGVLVTRVKINGELRTLPCEVKRTDEIVMPAGGSIEWEEP